MNAVAATPLAPFAVRVRHESGKVVVAPAGELDLASAALLEREFGGLPRDGRKRVVLDLREVQFIDSTGLRLLLSLRNTAKRERRSLRVVPGPARVQRIFELTCTHGLFDWVEAG